MKKECKRKIKKEVEKIERKLLEEKFGKEQLIEKQEKKNKTWTELTMNENGNLEIIKVVEFGLKKSSRKVKLKPTTTTPRTRKMTPTRKMIGKMTGKTNENYCGKEIEPGKPAHCQADC